jgi:hypothetical protein
MLEQLDSATMATVCGGAGPADVPDSFRDFLNSRYGRPPNFKPGVLGALQGVPLSDVVSCPKDYEPVFHDNKIACAAI